MAESSSGGVGIFTVLGLIFVTLKLVDVIAWSWWWVLAPFWIPALFALVFLVIYLIAVERF